MEAEVFHGASFGRSLKLVRRHLDLQNHSVMQGPEYFDRYWEMAWACRCRPGSDAEIPPAGFHRPTTKAAWICMRPFAARWSPSRPQRLAQDLQRSLENSGCSSRNNTPLWEGILTRMGVRTPPESPAPKWCVRRAEGAQPDYGISGRNLPIVGVYLGAFEDS
jgi:hypothetical protein